MSVATAGVVYAQGTITYFRFEADEAAIWKMRDNVSQQTQVITPGSDIDPRPNLSPTGGEICRMNLDGSNVVRLTDNSAEERDPAWCGLDKVVSQANWGETSS